MTKKNREFLSSHGKKAVSKKINASSSSRIRRRKHIQMRGQSNWGGGGGGGRKLFRKEEEVQQRKSNCKIATEVRLKESTTKVTPRMLLMFSGLLPLMFSEDTIHI